jgi:membrane associated rhomboid family serine protease
MKATELLLSIIIVSFILQFLVKGFTEAFYFDPDKAFTEPWRFITSMFLHGNSLHIFLNAFGLLMFGPILERKVGSKEFIKIFFISGIVGNALYYLTVNIGLAIDLPALGASGGLFGIMAATAVLMPKLVVYIWFFPMYMSQALILWFITEFIGTFDMSSGIASAAHLGGLLTGYIYAKKFFREQEIEWWMLKGIR